MAKITSKMKLSPAARGALGSLFNSAGNTNGQTGGIGPRWLLGRIVTSRGLKARGAIVEHPAAGLFQITAAGCEAIGRSMDEIVAWAWDAAVAEYWERTTLAAGNLMVEMPKSTRDDDFDGPEDFTSRPLDMRRIAEARERHGVKPTDDEELYERHYYRPPYDDSTWPPRGAGE